DTIMIDLESWITEDTTEAEIIEYLNDACSILYLDSLVDMCDDILDEFMDEILELLQEDYPADVVCELIGMCDSAPMLKDSGIWCTICELIAEMAEEWITDASTENEIIEWLEGICTFLPSFLERECDQFIESEVESLAVALLSDLPPDVVCQDIGACDAPTQTVGGWSIWCDVCETIMVDVR
ncbi:hypothetical protein KIPB_013907, partial [Kipferlia bialata]